MNLNRIDCQYVDIEITATLRDGGPATLTSIGVAVLRRGMTPTAATVWLPSAYTDGKATVLLAGPEVQDVAEAIVVPCDGGDLWVRVLDDPEIDAALIEHIYIT